MSKDQDVEACAERSRKRACHFDKLSAQPEPVEGLARPNPASDVEKGAASSLSACEHAQAGAPTIQKPP